MAVVIFGSQFFMKKFHAAAAGRARRATGASFPRASEPPARTPVAVSGGGFGAKARQSRAATGSAKSVQAATESETVVENGLYRITFTNRGAQVKSWVLKTFKDDSGKPLDLVNARRVREATASALAVDLRHGAAR